MHEKKLSVMDIKNNLNNQCNGIQFQNLVKDWLCKNVDQYFKLETKIPVGKPSKDHRFDIVNRKKKIAIECKCYTWTKTGKVPSAKINAINSDVLYLSLLPDDYAKYIVILCSRCENGNESLAEYYFRTYRHLIGEIKIAEYDPNTNKMHMIV